MSAGALHVVGARALLRALRQLAPQEIALLNALGAGGLVTREELVDRLWGDNAEGGPLDVYGVIRMRVLALRRRGYVIHTSWRFGYSLRRAA